MPPQLRKVTSFSLEIDDWHSCHTSDDEAYQDALERNSVASFYTARGAASSAASVAYISIALGSPSRLADADHALAEMVPEPLSDARGQHEPPEFEAHELPACKRNRYSPRRSTAMVPPPTLSSTPVAKAKLFPRWGNRRGMPMRASSPCMFRNAVEVPAAPPPPPELPAEQQPSSALHVSITVLPDGASVQLHLSPAVFCFGSVTLPAPNAACTDYSAVLLGPDGGLATEDSNLGYGELHPAVQGYDQQGADPLPAAASDSYDDASSPVPSRQRDNDSRNDPKTPKDQTKARRRAEDKDHKPGERKAGGGFPGSMIIQRLFSGLRSSFGGSSSHQAPPPATIQELGSELLLASAAAAPPGLALAAAAAQSVPVIAGYVHASTSANASPDAAPSDSAVDEAAAAAHRLSAGIFRNVLRASAGGAEDAPLPKPLASPRDTAFHPAEVKSPQRDQLPAPQAPVAAEETTAVDDNVSSQPVTPTGRAAGSGSNSQHQSPGDDRQPAPGLAALALLAGLAADATADDAVGPCPGSLHEQQQQQAPAVMAAEVEQASAVSPEVGGALAVAGSLTVQTSQAGEGVDGSDLPTPQLEQCDSPVTAKTEALAASALDDTATSPEAPPPASPPPSAVPADVADPSPVDTASPRTISKKAYGTVARLVKKMAPNYRDSTVASIMSTGASASGSSLALPPAFSDPPALPAPGGAPAAAAPLAPALSEVSSGSGPGESGGSQAPPMFVFGQEQPKPAKQPTIKTRPPGPKTAAPAADDQAAPAEATGRKRKAELEILPNAKLPVVAQLQRQPPPEPHPTAVAPETPGNAPSGPAHDAADSTQSEGVLASPVTDGADAGQSEAPQPPSPAEGHQLTAPETSEVAVGVEAAAAAAPSALAAAEPTAAAVSVPSEAEEEDDNQVPSGTKGAGVEVPEPPLPFGSPLVEATRARFHDQDAEVIDEAKEAEEAPAAAAAATSDKQEEDTVPAAADKEESPVVTAPGEEAPGVEAVAVKTAAAAKSTDEATEVEAVVLEEQDPATPAATAAGLPEAVNPAPPAAGSAKVVEEPSDKEASVEPDAPQVPNHAVTSSAARTEVGTAAEASRGDAAAPAAAAAADPQAETPAASAKTTDDTSVPIATLSDQGDMAASGAAVTAATAQAARGDPPLAQTPNAANADAMREQACAVAPQCGSVSAAPAVVPKVAAGSSDGPVQQAPVEPSPACSVGQPASPPEAKPVVNVDSGQITAAATCPVQKPQEPASTAAELAPTSAMEEPEAPKSATTTVQVTRAQAPAEAEGVACGSACATAGDVDAKAPVTAAVQDTPTATLSTEVKEVPKGASCGAAPDTVDVSTTAGAGVEGGADEKKSKDQKASKKAKKLGRSLFSCFRA